jgi:hypothetical protein
VGGWGKEIQIRLCFTVGYRIIIHTKLLRFFFEKIFTRITGLKHTGAKNSANNVLLLLTKTT